MAQPSTAALRKTLETLLISDADLDAFCIDYFPEVYRRFTRGMDRVTKFNVLLERVSAVDILRQLGNRINGPLASKASDELSLVGDLVAYGAPIPFRAPSWRPVQSRPASSSIPAIHGLTAEGAEAAPRSQMPAATLASSRNSGAVATRAAPSRWGPAVGALGLLLSAAVAVLWTHFGPTARKLTLTPDGTPSLADLWAGQRSAGGPLRFIPAGPPIVKPKARTPGPRGPRRRVDSSQSPVRELLDTDIAVPSEPRGTRYDNP